MGKVNQTQGIMTKEQFNASPLKNIMSYEDYFMRALKTGSAFNFDTNVRLNITNNIFQSRFALNPIKSEKKSEVDEILEKLPNVKDSELANEIESLLQGGTPSKAFIDLLIKRYEKKQAEFEVAWERYQVAKGQRTTLKAALEKIQKKYEGSESAYENGLVKNAEKNYKTADLDADIYLSIVSYLAHRAV